MSIDPITLTSYSFPSSLYEKTLTLGTTGTTYTAPSTGWVFLHKIASVAAEYIALTNYTSKLLAIAQMSGASDEDLRVYIPVSKNDTFKINYTATGDTEDFKFIYAKGSESEYSE